MRKAPGSVAEIATGVAEHQALVGDLIRRHRTLLGISQERLAKRAGISPSMMSEIELGVAPNDQFVACVLEALRLEALRIAKAALHVLSEEEPEGVKA